MLPKDKIKSVDVEKMFELLKYSSLVKVCQYFNISRFLAEKIIKSKIYPIIDILEDYCYENGLELNRAWIGCDKIDIVYLFGKDEIKHKSVGWVLIQNFHFLRSSTAYYLFCKKIKKKRYFYNLNKKTRIINKEVKIKEGVKTLF